MNTYRILVKTENEILELGIKAKNSTAALKHAKAWAAIYQPNFKLVKISKRGLFPSSIPAA